MEARELALCTRAAARPWARRSCSPRASVGRTWIADDARRRPVKVLARAFGARDLALGLGVVIALDRGAPVRGWIEAGALSDAIDTCASLLAGSSIPPAVRWPCVALGAGSAALGAYLAPQLDDPPAPIPGRRPRRSPQATRPSSG